MNRKQRFAASVNAVAARRRTMLDLQDASNAVVPYAYATMIMALNELTDMSQEAIEDVVLRSQEIWDNWEYGTESPLDVCDRLTGIRLKSVNDVTDEGWQE